VRFWDTSSIVPLLAVQRASAAAAAEFDRDPRMIVWWATQVECISAIARLEREGKLSANEVVEAKARMGALEGSWAEIEPAARVRQTATRLVRVHPLRAADAFHLAAAIVAADGEPRSLPFVTLDERLARAAEREGFSVVEPA
jgi:predicted nucleic acid-binding protein